jgi:hypothetical protein
MTFNSIDAKNGFEMYYDEAIIRPGVASSAPTIALVK